MNTENTTPIDDSVRTLRSALIKPWPTVTPSAWPIPNENGVTDAAPYRWKDNPDYVHVNHMIQELLHWACLTVAHNAYHTSDSEVDSMNALILIIATMHMVNYGDDLTLSLQEATDRWLDSEGSWMDLQMASDPNWATDPDLADPEIFSYFDLRYNAFDLAD